MEPLVDRLRLDGLVPAGCRDAALQVVGHVDGRAGAEPLQHPDVRSDPVRQLLAERGLDVEVAAGPQGSDKKLNGGDLAGHRIHDLGPLAGEVNEDLLARVARLAHRRVQSLREAPVVLAVLAVAIAVGVVLGILRPEQLQGDASALELLVDKRQVERGPGQGGRGGARVEPHLQRRVVQVDRKRPGKSGLLSSGQVLRDRAQANPGGAGDLAVGQAKFVPKSQDVAQLLHP